MSADLALAAFTAGALMFGSGLTLFAIGARSTVSSTDRLNRATDMFNEATELCAEATRERLASFFPPSPAPDSPSASGTPAEVDGQSSGPKPISGGSVGGAS